jgi:pimeloyl-ACP methyl ester carboxylesterase
VAGLDRPIKLDPNHIVYFGHSQGCLTGPLFLAYEPLVRSAVLSGAGGDLIRSLLTKTQPLDIAGLTRLMLSDRDVGPMHPMLNLLQLYFDPIDVVNYGRALTFEPLPVGQTDDEPPEPILAGPNNVFMSYGRDDHYSTERTMIAFARSLGVHQLEPGSDCACLDECDAVDAAGLHRSACRIDGLLTTAAPVRANAWAAGADFTAVLKLYLPAGEDGHQVLFEPGQGPQDYRGFIGSAIADPEGIPTLFGAGQ